MRILSLLSPADVEELGELPNIGICGKLEGNSDRPEGFIENPAFSDFLHDVLKFKASTLESVRLSAERQQEGYLYIIDLRTPEGIMGNVPPEDIIGALKVSKGLIVEGEYFRNQSHKIYTSNGLLKLPPELLTLLIEEIKRNGKADRN